MNSHQQTAIENAAHQAADKWVYETNGQKWSNNDDTGGDNFGSYKAGFLDGHRYRPTPPPTLQEQAQAYMDKGHWKRGQHEEIYNAFLAGHAQASGSLREQLDNCKSMWEAEAERRVEMEGKLKVATDVLKDIMMRYESGDMACVLANDGLNKIQEK